MTRFTSTSMQALSEATNIAFRLLSEIDVTSGTLYVCSGRNFVYARSNTYTPVGGYGGLEKIQEESDPFPRAVRMWLCAAASFTDVNSSLFSTTMNEQLFNKQVRIYRGFLDPQTMLMPNTPEMAFKGQVSAFEYRPEDPEYGPSFQIEVESRMLKRMNPAYFNKESYWTTLSRSGDTFFNLVPKVPGATAKWGSENSVIYGRLTPYPGIPGMPPGWYPRI